MKYIKTFEDIHSYDIFIAINEDDLNEVKRLIKSGADLNVKNKRNQTPLLLLAESLQMHDEISKYNL